MKHTYTKVLFGALLIGAFLMPEMVEGKSVYWTKTENTGLAYLWNCADGSFGNCGGQSGWELGMSAPQVDIYYFADVYNADTGLLVPDGSSVQVGTRLQFVPKANADTDLTWFASGYSSDSPNGHWINGAAAPAFGCFNGDKSATNVELVSGGVANGNVYTPLSVNPPNKRIDISGTATLTPQGGNIYRVDGPGTINADVVFEATYGEFYYRYLATSKSNIWMGRLNTCYGNQTPMDTFDGYPFVFCIFNCSQPVANHSDYKLQVPSRAVSFTFNVPSNNNSPNPPSLTGPTSGSTNTNYPFNTQATDPDGDTIRYGIDWDNNGSVDEWTAYVASNTLVTTNHQWATAGSYTLKALTQDNKGGTSGWSAPLTINIQTIVNGVCGAANAFPTTNPPTVGLCFSGTPTPVTPGVAPGPYTWNCTGSGGGTNAVCNAPYLTPAPTFNFQINGVVADGALTVNRNANLNIIFDTVTDATSCSGTGNGWTGAKATTGGNDNISATAASLYQLSCTGPGGTTTKTISVTLQPTLKICQNSCSSNIEPPSSFSMNRFDTKNLVACYNDALDCTMGIGDVTTSATWTEGGGNPVSISGGTPKRVSADNPGTESISASYNSNTVTKNITVTCTDAGACQRDANYNKLCQKDTYTVVDSCGVTQTCNGTKTCDYNWKEVAP